MRSPGAVRTSQSPSRIDDAKVLVVEDDAALAEIVSIALTSRGYRVHVAPTGRAALDTSWVEQPDVVILDLGLPDIDGIDVCRALRRWFYNPIVVLSADGAEDRKITALDEGADDYVTKPFSMGELLARLRVALRHRRAIAAVADPAVLEVGDITIDTGAHAVAVAGRAVELRRKEFDLLVLLARQPGRVFTHSTILTHVWGSSGDGNTGSLRVHMTQLRKKLGQGSDRPRLLTEPGVGYRLIMPDEDG
jgi:two-component system KDP operon response regulator KdpE